jgi:hypothetical protein
MAKLFKQLNSAMNGIRQLNFGPENDLNEAND